MKRFEIVLLVLFALFILAAFFRAGFNSGRQHEAIDRLKSVAHDETNPNVTDSQIFEVAKFLVASAFNGNASFDDQQAQIEDLGDGVYRVSGWGFTTNGTQEFDFRVKLAFRDGKWEGESTIIYERGELFPDPPQPDETDFKTEAEAWEAAKVLAAGSVEGGATFGEQTAADVVERTGNGSFRIRATVYSRDADGINAKDFDCKMASIDGEWYGVLTFTADLVEVE